MPMSATRKYLVAVKKSERRGYESASCRVSMPVRNKASTLPLVDVQFVGPADDEKDQGIATQTHDPGNPFLDYLCPASSLLPRLQTSGAKSPTEA